MIRRWLSFNKRFYICKLYKQTTVKTLALFILLFSLIPVGIAAELTIVVLQKGTGDPVSGATVVLEKTEDYGETDAEGKILFEDVEAPLKIKILNQGYETLNKTISSIKKTNKVYLEPLAIEGDVIEVFAERVEEKTSKFVLSKETLRKTPGTQGDPLKAIQSLPGVVTGAEGEGIFYVRGSEPNQSIVWVNRARIGYLYHFGGLHSTISPQLVSDFNMFLGGFPVEYGDALGGALDVKLRTPKNDRWHQNYSLGTYESSFVLEGPVGKKNGKTSAYVSARRSYIDLIFDPETFTEAFNGGEDEEFQNTITQVPVFYDVQAVLERQIKNGRMLFQHFSASDRIKLELNSTKNTDPSATGKLSTSVSYHSSSFVWEQKWNPKLYSVSSLYYIYADQSLEIGQDETGNPFFLNIEERDLIWQPEVSWLADENTTVSGGVEAIYASTPVTAFISRPPGFDDLDYNLTTGEKFTVDKTYNSGLISPYVKLRRKWFNRFTTQFGIRHSHLRSNGRNELNGTSPRLSLEYDLTEKTILTGVWGRYLQLPEGSQWVREAGNPDLPFLEAEHRIVGVKHIFDETWNMQIEAYHKPMKNLVVSYSDPAPDNYRSDGTGRVYGFDVLVKREYSGRKMGWLSYSYLDSQRTARGVTFPFAGDQRHSLTLVWSQPLPGSWKRWTIGLRARINSGRPFTPINGRIGYCEVSQTYSLCADQNNPESDPNFSHYQPDWAKQNSDRLPMFYQLDLRFDREVLYNTWKMNIYLDILNVLNIKNVTGYDYGNSLEDIDDPKEEISLPLFPSFGIEIEI